METTREEDFEALVARMAKVGNCTSPTFSPDGARLAFVSNLSGLPQVWTVSVEGGWPEPVTALNDPIAQVQWSPDGNWLAFMLAPGGGMNSQIYLVRPDGTGMRRLTAGGKDNNWLGPWTYDSRYLFISSNQRSPEAMDCYLVNIESGEFRLVAENQGVGRIEDVSQNGKYATLARVVNRSDNNLYLLDLEIFDRKILLTPHEGPGSFGSSHFSPDGNTIYLTSNKDRELLALAQVRLDANGQPGELEVIAARENAELQSFIISEDGKTAALLWNEGGRNTLEFLDLATQTTVPGPPLPAEVASFTVFSRDGKYLALNLGGAAAPFDLWIMQSNGSGWSTPRQITRSPHAGIILDKLVRPELVRFPAQDGLELSGWLYRVPDQTAPGPVVLSFHGGPEAQERPFFNGDYQALLSQGIGVFAPNVRGSTGFGKTFTNLDNGPLRFDAIRDIKACVDYVVDAGVADPRRIGIMGGSYGGYMTMAGITEYPELFAAAANLFGIVNFETFFAQTEPWMAAISKVEYGDPDSQLDLLRQLSPIHRLDQVITPTLVIHGANDTNCPVIEAEQVVENLRKREVPVEYILFPDEGHGFRKIPNRVRATTGMVAWFSKYLKYISNQ